MVDIAIGGSTAVQNSVTQNTDARPEAKKTGSGVALQSGPVPTPVRQGYQNILQSLVKFATNSISGEQVDILIAEATLKLKELVGQTNTNDLNAKAEQQRQTASERAAKFEEAERKQVEAEKAQKSSGIWGKFKQAFAVIGAIAMIAVGAALMATGVGAAIGGPIIAMGAIGLVMAIDSIVQEQTGRGMMGHIAGGLAEVFGASEELADKWAKGFDIAFTVILAVAAVCCAIASFNAAGAVEGTALLLKTSAAVIGSATAVGTSGMQVGSSVKSFQAADRSADAQNLQADAAVLQAFTELLNDFIDQIMQQISNSSSQFNAMLDDVTSSIKDRGDTLARARFTG